MKIPYKVEHPYSGQTVQPEPFDVVEIDGLWYPRIKHGGVVFRNRQGFKSQLEAQRFLSVTIREGATIE